jgi:hypothetical protein
LHRHVGGLAAGAIIGSAAATGYAPYGYYGGGPYYASEPGCGWRRERFLGWLSLARPSGSSLLLTQSEPAFRKGCLDILHCRLSVRPFASNQISDKLGMPILPGCIWA